MQQSFGETQQICSHQNLRCLHKQKKSINDPPVRELNFLAQQWLKLHTRHFKMGWNKNRDISNYYDGMANGKVNQKISILLHIPFHHSFLTGPVSVLVVYGLF